MTVLKLCPTSTVGTVRFPASFKASFQFMFERVIGIITKKKTDQATLAKPALFMHCYAAYC